jgi:hypothetical protein
MFRLLPLLLLTASWATAATVTIAGTLVDAPAFRRPSTVSLNSLAFGDFPYQAWEFSVDTAGSYAMGTVSPVAFDAFIILYQSPFDPQNALANGLSAADGGGGLIDGVNTSDRIIRNLEADTLYTLVVTTLSASVTPSAYQAIISGPGAIDVCASGTGCNAGTGDGGGAGPSEVPEPSTALLLAAGLAAVTRFRARRD